MPASRRIACSFAALATALCAPAQAQTERLAASLDYATLAAYVRDAARMFGLPEAWIHAVLWQESRGRPNAMSPAGAMGLMQVMPRTWQRQRARYALGHDPFEPRNNILAGTSYLREMYDAFGMPGCLAAYNAGPGRFRQWRDQGRALPAETLSYVAAVSGAIGHSAVPVVQTDGILAAMSWMQSELFPGLPPEGRLHDDSSAPKRAGVAGPVTSRSQGRLFADIIQDHEH